jgi:hypothetical protein
MMTDDGEKIRSWQEEPTSDKETTRHWGEGMNNAQKTNGVNTKG